MSVVNIPLAFNRMGNSMQGANPDKGDGFLGPWPPEGDAPQILTGIVFNDKVHYYFQPKGAKDPTKMPAVSIQHLYRSLSDPTAPEALEWKGKPIILPCSEFPADGAWEDGWGKARKDRDRLAGFFSTIMGRPWNPAQFGSEIGMYVQKLSDPHPVIATIRAEYRKYAKRGEPKEDQTKWSGLERTDYCRDLNQGPAVESTTS